MEIKGVVLQFRSHTRQRVARLHWKARGALCALAAVLLLGLAPNASAQVLQPGDLAPDNQSHAALPSSLGGAAAQPAAVGPDGLPPVLDTRDAELYRRIFAVQEAGHWAEADKLIAQLSDRRLMGHVLAQRYLHPTAYRSKYLELKELMDHYADHPQAKRI